MTREMKVEADYLYLPICVEKEERLFEIFYTDETNRLIKLMEFLLPVEDTGSVYSYDYYARFPVKQFTDKTLTLKGDVPEAFMKEVIIAPFMEYEPLGRPSAHYTAPRGWINDPNGLVYQEGYYHLYYQYNPCNTKWNNMSWGHAVSKDLLHWEDRDIVLTPDEDGTIFSGSAIINERGMLGLPKNALLYYYTAAGGENHWGKGKHFIQKLAYSLDNGDTLIKTDLGKLERICKENRDPKVLWHEESQAYIMCLWLEENDFAILRSGDLQEWSMTDKLTLKEAWECPELMRVPTEDGGSQWVFWSADGFYYWGEFDGYRFHTDGVKHNAYINRLSYAAQSYSGLKDRVVMIPWIRSRREGRSYQGAMGLPRELSVVSCQGERYLAQQPIRELRESSKLIYRKEDKEQAKHYVLEQQEKAAIVLDMVLSPGVKKAVWNINQTMLSYDAEGGLLQIGEESYDLGKEIMDFSFLLDTDLFEVTANHGIILGVFELEKAEPMLETDTGQFESLEVYRID